MSFINFNKFLKRNKKNYWHINYLLSFYTVATYKNLYVFIMLYILKTLIFKQTEFLTKLNVLIQRYYQKLENKIQSATEIYHLDIIEINYQSKTTFLRRKFSETQQKLQNENSKIIKDKLETLSRDLGKYIYETVQKIENKRQNLLYKGLSKERIQHFHHFIADESYAGDQCTICIQDVEVGRKMMRLDCKHEFCKECIEGWFAEHKTCPNCRNLF